MKVPLPKIATKPIDDMKKFLFRERPKKQAPRIRRPRAMTKAYQYYGNNVRLRVWLILAENKLTFTEVSILLGIPRYTVVKMYNSFVKYGTYKKYTSKGRTPTPIPEEVEDFLTKDLNALRFLSIRERCTMAWQKFGYKLLP